MWFLIFLSLALGGTCSIQERYELHQQYKEHCDRGSDINEHIPVLCDLARECSSVIEIGLRNIVSTWGILEGLAESPHRTRSYLGIDIARPPLEKLTLARTLAKGSGIQFEFWEADDTKIEIPAAEMLFIDSLHLYCHMTYELETFSPKISKIICMHDTSPPFESRDQWGYDGDLSEYPAWIDHTKRGVWTAVADFLARHPEWRLHERRTNNHGFTILRRVAP
jgi:hypothetical protein